MGLHLGDLSSSSGGTSDFGPPNSAEFILTEGYAPVFQGSPSSISSDGRVLTIPSNMGSGAPR